MNKIYLHGRLTKDPETRMAGQSSVCSFTVACDRAYKNASGERETDFIDVSAWAKLGETVQKWFGKGREIIVHGELQSRKYQDKNGNNRIAWQVRADSIEFCGSKGEERTPSSGTLPGTTMNPDDLFGGELDCIEPIDDSELPF